MTVIARFTYLGVPIGIILALAGMGQLGSDVGTGMELIVVGILGAVLVGADQVSITQFEVLSFAPFGDSWRLMLNGELRGRAAAMLSALK